MGPPGLIGDGLRVVAEFGEDTSPAFIDRIGVGEIAGIEVFNENTVGAKQEGGVFNPSCHESHAMPFKRLVGGRRASINQPFIAFSMALPRLAGESATAIPALFIASILSSAPPLPPAMIAPA